MVRRSSSVSSRIFSFLFVSRFPRPTNRRNHIHIIHTLFLFSLLLLLFFFVFAFCIRCNSSVYVHIEIHGKKNISKVKAVILDEREMLVTRFHSMQIMFVNVFVRVCVSFDCAGIESRAFFVGPILEMHCGFRLALALGCINHRLDSYTLQGVYCRDFTSP